MAFIDAGRIPATGHPRIDAGHEELAGQINSLYERWREGAPQDDILRHLDLLVRAIGRHFAEEEDIGRQVGYRYLAEHQARHVSLLAELTDLVEDMRSDASGRDRAIDVFTVIDSLLYEHEIVDDQDYWLLFRDGLPEVPQPSGVIDWGADLRTGLPDIDADHQGLIDLLNRLSTALGTAAPPSAVGYLLNRVLEHSQAHFAREERMMAEADAPSLDTHRALHAHLLDDLQGVIERHARGEYPNLHDLLHGYLKYWLIDHIRNVDAVSIPVRLEAKGLEDEAKGPEASEPVEA